LLLDERRQAYLGACTAGGEEVTARISMLDEKILEQRLAELERAVADLQRRLDEASTSANWLDKVIGSISDEPAFLETLEFGRTLRDADRCPDEPVEQA
jgi:hypothetical protein